MTAKLVFDLPHPVYSDHTLYHAYGGRPGRPAIRAWEFNGWRAESLSWKQGCYIHAGLSRSGPISIKGPDAKRYLQGLVINSLEKFPVGSMKHAVMCNDEGIIVAHGIVERKGEAHFESFAGGPPPTEAHPGAGFDLEIERLDHYLFQIAGPTSLPLLEKVTGESLRDLGFLRFRATLDRRARLGGVGLGRSGRHAGPAPHAGRGPLAQHGQIRP